MSVATLVDLWYVAQTTQGVSAREPSELRSLLTASPTIDLHPIDAAVADVYTTISRDVLTDPWDRFIVATALMLQAPLVTRDGAIQRSGLVETVWQPQLCEQRRSPLGSPGEAWEELFNHSVCLMAN